MTTEIKEQILGKAIECDICREWIAYSMITANFDAEAAVERQAYYDANADHILSHAKSLIEEVNLIAKAREDAKAAKVVSERDARQSHDRVTLSGRPPEQLDGPAPAPIEPSTGMHKDYWVLPPEERAKGFIRPLRLAYTHNKCGTSTRMNTAIAETYARNPGYYGRTFCVACGGHYPVGADGEFLWNDGSKVGT